MTDLATSTHQFAIMGKAGDTKHSWDPTNPEEVETARALFVDLTSKGYLAFRLVSFTKDEKKMVRKGEELENFDADAGRMRFVKPKNAEEVPATEGEQIKEFDATAPQVLLVPPMTGG